MTEADRSRASLPGRNTSLPSRPALDVEQGTALGDSLPDVTPSAASSSVDAFHSMPPSPTQLTEPSHPSPSPAASLPRSPSPSIIHREPQPETSSDTRSLAENHTAPLPEIPPWHPRETHADMTEPLHAVTEEASDVEMADAAVEAPTSPKGLTHKASVSSFPSLPAPLPFRKSIRVPSDPSTAHGNLGAATPGGALAGKRTSWLMRAREVKALEITVKKPNPLPSLAPGTSSGNKRKSGDMFAVPGATGLEEEERKPKVAKTVESDAAPLRSKTPDSAKLKPDQDVEPPREQPQEEQEGLLVQLKRTVDDLGSRFGKSMGKSLGGAAAANALAEARAAAEARLAERQHKKEEATMALGAPAVAPTRSSTETEHVPCLPFVSQSSQSLRVGGYVSGKQRQG
ncbi:hypothetical protein B0H14DRAFT_1560997 [Mycena olivaceomarginata]|nr:hypothetical protein B0H14DRAFT_1560997 [Mycena olivaceomarginata]